MSAQAYGSAFQALSDTETEAKSVCAMQCLMHLWNWMAQDIPQAEKKKKKKIQN